MIIKQMAIHRRTFLRGMGVTVAIPFLDAMVPALSARANMAVAPAHRLVFYGGANGVYGPHFRPKGDSGPLLKGELPPILAPLELVLDQTVVAGGLSNLCAESKDIGSGAHARSAGAFLSGIRPKRTEGADIMSGTTIDQFAAKKLGNDTQLSSLELALESSYVGNCDQGYSCAYVNTFSWRTPTQPLPMDNNPRSVFERLFGDGGSLEARLEQMQTDRSILDWVAGDMKRLQKRLGPADRMTVSEYLDAVRDVERRIQKAEQHSATTPLPQTSQPLGIPESFAEHAQLMVDLQFLALQADVTRVISFQTSREQGGRQFPFLGVPESHHETSHHAGDPYKIGQNTKINTYFMQLFASLAERMRATPDGDGSLLDHAMLFWGSALGSGDLHSPHDLPVALVGGGCGSLKGGRYLSLPLDTPFMNFGLSLLEKVGVELESIGDSTGRLADL